MALGALGGEMFTLDLGNPVGDDHRVGQPAITVRQRRAGGLYSGQVLVGGALSVSLPYTEGVGGSSPFIAHKSGVALVRANYSSAS